MAANLGETRTHGATNDLISVTYHCVRDAQNYGQ